MYLLSVSILEAPETTASISISSDTARDKWVVAGQNRTAHGSGWARLMKCPCHESLSAVSYGGLPFLRGSHGSKQGPATHNISSHRRLAAGFPGQRQPVGRSFVLGEAGSRTQVVSLWAALFTLLTLLFLGPLVAELPFAALAGIVIVAGAGLLAPAEFRALWHFRKTEFWPGIVTIAAVLFLGMLIGILIAAVFSLLEIALRAASPQTAVLGRLPGTDTYRRLRRSPDAETIPGLVIFRLDAPLFFANANHFREGVIRAVEAAPEPVTELLVDAEAMYDIDCPDIPRAARRAESSEHQCLWPE